MRRIFLILMLMIMASINVLLDFLRHASISDVNENVFLSIFVTGFATGIPAVLAFLISAKMHFQVSGINVYRVVSDCVLAIGLVTWFYFLFIRDRRSLCSLLCKPITRKNFFKSRLLLM
jgi:hypothetical protein